jgi:tRNA threonylcarbamoyladenosine biosynthesis protein TsaE
MNYYLASPEATVELGKKLAKIIKAPLVIGFKGEIGRGKTSLIRAMLRELGVQSAIKSPTFNLVETYQTAVGIIHHFDLYRLNSVYDLEDLGFRDYLEASEISCIEWPENAPLLCPLLDIVIEINLSNQGDGREVLINSQTDLGEKMIKKLMELTC